MPRKRNPIRISKDDTLDEAYEKNQKLVNQVRNLEKKINTLKSHNKTLTSAWYKTEDFLSEITGGKSLKEILLDIKDHKKLTKIKCPSCGGSSVKRTTFSSFSLVICDNCDYRKREDDGIS